jgi:hypothetical protein
MVVTVIFPSIIEIQAAKKNIIVALHIAHWHFILFCFYTYGNVSNIYMWLELWATNMALIRSSKNVPFYPQKICEYHTYLSYFLTCGEY